MHWMFLPLKRYAEFSGRSRRTEYWMFVLFQILLAVAFWVLMAIIGGSALLSGSDPAAWAAAGGMVMIAFALYGLISLALIIPGIAVTVRRLHDTNRTGWWVLPVIAGYLMILVASGMTATSSDPTVPGILSLIGMIALFGVGLIVLVFMFLEGTRGPNQYGPDPKGEALDQVFA